MKLAEVIRHYREEKGMSQSELAKAAGYKTRSSITKIEKGESIPSPEKILAMSEALEIPMIDMLFHVDDDEFKTGGMRAALAMAYMLRKEPAPSPRQRLNALVAQIPDDKADLVIRILESILADSQK